MVKKPELDELVGADFYHFMADNNLPATSQRSEIIYRLVQVSPCVLISAGIIALHVYSQGLLRGLISALCLLVIYLGAAMVLAYFAPKPKRAWLTGALFCFISVIFTFIW
jgi:hypothetical protein